jgi:hypothetical protein
VRATDLRSRSILPMQDVVDHRCDDIEIGARR